MTHLIEQTRDYVQALTQNEATGHDWQHTLRVTEMAQRLIKAETQAVNEEVILLACLLHDVKDYKLSGDEAAGPQAAKDWLTQLQADPALIDHVVAIITSLSFKGQVHRPMATKEGMIVQDADRLDAVGAIGIARAFAYGGAHSRAIVDPKVPYRKTLTPQAYKDKTHRTTSLNHFYEKLLKLDGHYHTPLANAIGHERHMFMKTYVLELLKEIQLEDPDYLILDDPD